MHQMLLRRHKKPPRLELAERTVWGLFLQSFYRWNNQLIKRNNMQLVSQWWKESLVAAVDHFRLMLQRSERYKRGENTADRDPERGEDELKHMLLSHAPPCLCRHTSFSHTHTYSLTQLWVTCRSFRCAVGSITGLLTVKKWVTRGSCPIFLGAIICCHSSVTRPRRPLSHFSMDNGFPPSPLHLSAPLSLSLSVLDHWLTQYCLRLIAKGSRLRAKRLLTLASAAEEGVRSLECSAEWTDNGVLSCVRLSTYMCLYSNFSYK